MARQTKAQKIYREKYNLVQKLNKRMMDIAKHIGNNTIYNDDWETLLTVTIKGSEDTYSAHTIRREITAGGKTILGLAKGRKDVEAYSLEDLKQFERKIDTWSKVKADLTARLNEDRAPDDQYTRSDPPTDAELRRAAGRNYYVNKAFEENADLFYMLLDTTDWEDIKDHTTDEIYEKIKEINQKIAKSPRGLYSWQHTPGELSKRYIARRDAARERKAQIMRSVDF